MYTISNSQRAEIAKLLAALTRLPGDSDKAANLRRRARIAINRINKAKLQPPHPNS